MATCSWMPKASVNQEHHRQHWLRHRDKACCPGLLSATPSYEILYMCHPTEGAVWAAPCAKSRVLTLAPTVTLEGSTCVTLALQQGHSLQSQDLDLGKLALMSQATRSSP